MTIRPDHYTQGATETKDIIRMMGDQVYVSFCVGNVIKYLTRAPFKDSWRSDLEKALTYLGFILEVDELWQFKRDFASRYKAVKAAKKQPIPVELCNILLFTIHGQYETAEMRLQELLEVYHD